MTRPWLTSSEWMIKTVSSPCFSVISFGSKANRWAEIVMVLGVFADCVAAGIAKAAHSRRKVVAGILNLMICPSDPASGEGRHIGLGVETLPRRPSQYSLKISWHADFPLRRGRFAPASGISPASCDRARKADTGDNSQTNGSCGESCHFKVKRASSSCSNKFLPDFRLVPIGTPRLVRIGTPV